MRRLYASGGDYPDALTFMGIGAIGQVPTPFNYVPDLAPVGTGPAYFPRDIGEDAKALNFLGFMSDDDFAQGNESTGTQKGDIAESVGAWDPKFRAAVTRYEAARQLKVDSFIGPQVRTSLKKDVDAKNAAGVPPAPVPPLPAVVIPVDPGGVPGGSAPLPGIAESSDALLYVGVGSGVVALLGLAYWALR